MIREFGLDGSLTWNVSLTIEVRDYRDCFLRIGIWTYMVGLCIVCCYVFVPYGLHAMDYVYVYEFDIRC